MMIHDQHHQQQTMNPDENLMNRFSSMSSISLSAAVTSAFNLFKQKQLSAVNKYNSGINNGDQPEAFAQSDHFRDISNSENYDATTSNNRDDSNDTELNDSFNYYTNKLGHFYHSQQHHPHTLPQLSILKSKYFESPINQSQIQYDCPAPIARNTPENNVVTLVDYRQTKVASFCVDNKELICLPQAFELFLKNLVGGLHTVYTKLKRLDIVPIVCNVEQVRVLRGLGAIQPGVNRCKLIAPNEFDILYEDCTNSGSRPGRPPKRHGQNESENSQNQELISEGIPKTTTSPVSTSGKQSKQTNSNCGTKIRPSEQQGCSSMSPYSVLTSSSCSSSSIGTGSGITNIEESTSGINTAINNIVSPTGVSFMQKLGHFLPYSFNTNVNSNKHLSRAYEDSAYQLSSYDNENNLSTINNAAAAYALYGRMLQKQAPKFENISKSGVNSSPNYLSQHQMDGYKFPLTQLQPSSNPFGSQCPSSDQLTPNKSCNCELNNSDKSHSSEKTNSKKKLDLVETNCNKINNQKSASVVLKDGSKTLQSGQKNNSNFHPLSIEYLTGGIDRRANESFSSSGMSDIALETPVQNYMDSKTASNSVPRLCFLIDTVRENVLEIEKDFQNDIVELRKSLITERDLRVKSDVKINHLIRLQNKLRYKLKVQHSILFSSKLKNKKTRQSVQKKNLSSASHMETADSD